MKRWLLFFVLSVGLVTMAQAQQNPAPAKDTAALLQYVGKYVFPEGSVVPDVTVSIEDGALVMASSQGNSSLEKQGEDLYTIVQFQGTAKFNRDANKKIIGVSINAMGYQLEGIKGETKTIALANLKKYQGQQLFTAMAR
ncbi:MAG: hypothetical protein HYU71_13600 [Bacteroidetes bacterium]|nr:hypothetical protein [Bacteroidota bacterium]